MSEVVTSRHNVAINLDVAEYLSGWRPDGGLLFLPALSDGRAGDAVVARIGLFGHPIRATLLGSILSVRRVGRPALPPGVDLKLDAVSLPAARFLALAARGEKVEFRERAPRFVVGRSLKVLRRGVTRESMTVNVSEGGCALAWSGAVPAVGEVLSIRLGEGLFGPTDARAVVCWNSRGGSLEGCIGLRIVGDRRADRWWKQFTGSLSRAGVHST